MRHSDHGFAVLGEFRPVFGHGCIQFNKAAFDLDMQRDIDDGLGHGKNIEQGIAVNLGLRVVRDRSSPTVNDPFALMICCHLNADFVPNGDLLVDEFLNRIINSGLHSLFLSCVLILLAALSVIPWYLSSGLPQGAYEKKLFVLFNF
jgi:hypothetical protein